MSSLSAAYGSRLGGLIYDKHVQYIQLCSRYAIMRPEVGMMSPYSWHGNRSLSTHVHSSSRKQRSLMYSQECPVGCGKPFAIKKARYSGEGTSSIESKIQWRKPDAIENSTSSIASQFYWRKPDAMENSTSSIASQFHWS